MALLPYAASRDIVNEVLALRERLQQVRTDLPEQADLARRLRTQLRATLAEITAPPFLTSQPRT